MLNKNHDNPTPLDSDGSERVMFVEFCQIDRRNEIFEMVSRKDLLQSLKNTWRGERLLLALLCNPGACRSG